MLNLGVIGKIWGSHTEILYIWSAVKTMHIIDPVFNAINVVYQIRTDSFIVFLCSCEYEKCKMGELNKQHLNMAKLLRTLNF